MHPLLAEVVGELANPAPFDGVGTDVLGAELTDQDWCRAGVVDVTEALLPAVGEDRNHVRVREPRLRENARAVLVRRVDNTVGDVETHRVVANAFKIAAPPVTVELLAAGDRAFDSLNENQPVRRVGQNGVAGDFRGAAPVGGAAGAPSCLTVRLILEVGADHVRLACVTACESLPSVNPVGLGVATEAVPKRMHERIVGR